MRTLMLLAVSVLAVVSMAVSPALAHDRDGDGWDEELGFWTSDVEWDDSADFDEDDFDWDEMACVVENVDYSGVFEEWEVELACGLELLEPAPKQLQEGRSDLRALPLLRIT